MMLASGEDRPTNLRASFNDEELAARYGFPSEDFATSYVCKKIQDCRQKPELSQRVGQLRSQFLLDFSDVPLAHKKHRVLELVELYRDVDNLVVRDEDGQVVNAPLDDKVKRKQSILKQIAGEMDESADNLAAAIVQSTSHMVAGIQMTADLMLDMAYVFQQEAQNMQENDAELGTKPAHFGDQTQVPS